MVAPCAPAAGTIFPQPLISGKSRLDGRPGGGTCLIHRDDAIRSNESSDGSGIGKIDLRLDLPRGMSNALASWLNHFQVDDVLVRPDRYMFRAGTAARILHGWADRPRPSAIPA